MSHLIPNILLFLLSFIAGALAMRISLIDEKRMNLLLAFSGSFLLSITLLHLIPETVLELGHEAGIYILVGFFLQLIIQRFTHGVEHGHTHGHQGHHHDHHTPLFSILSGLGLHAFMEGLPLGFNYRMEGTDLALYLAIGIHKLPEVIIAATLIKSAKGNHISSYLLLGFFALLTPLGGALASFLGTRYFAMSTLVSLLIPVVAGAFIHIATTIFFESGTKHHTLTRQKTIAILLGVGLSACTLLLHHH